MIWKLAYWASWVLFVPFMGLFLWSLIPKKDVPARPIDWNAGRLRFPLDPIRLWAQYLAGMEFLLLSTEYLRQGFHASLDFLLGAIFCVGGLSALVASSIAIEVSDTGIEEEVRLGRNKFIRWGDIEEINIGKKDRLITIRSRKRTKIVYSMRPENRAQFLYEIKRHCGDELPPEFPGEPLEEFEAR